MTLLEELLQQLRDTDSTVDQLERAISENRGDDLFLVNAHAVKKRRRDLERRLHDELRVSQSDLVQYHVKSNGLERYPALAVAKAIAGFQELVTAVFDAIRTTPKQRYRPSAENIELSTLDFAMALPVGSVVVSMSVENERLILLQSELDKTFEQVFKILKTKDSEGLRQIASEVGIAPISKAHDWAASATQYGLNTSITIRKDAENQSEFEISNVEALALKEAIEEKSEKTITQDIAFGELVGIDVEPPNTYFHIKTVDGRNLDGRLADTFPANQEWAVHVQYTAHLMRVTTIRYATGEEKIEWLLANLGPVLDIVSTERDFPSN
jgi:hypothetical protein